MKVAPRPYLFNGILHVSFRQTIKKLERKQYRKFELFWKTESYDLVNLKLLLNHNELEKTIDVKKMRLDDIYPTVYHLLLSDERFRKKREKMLAATHRTPHQFQICY